MNDLLSRIAETDPDFAKSLRRNQVLSYVFAAVAIAAVLGAAYAIAVNFGQDKEITQVQHSACQEDPASMECQRTKLEAAKAASTYVNCIPFFKAGYACPKPGSTAAQRQLRRQVQAGSGSAKLDSEPASQLGGMTGGVKSPKGGNTMPPTPGKGGNKGGKVPTTKAPAAEPEAPPAPSPTAAPAAETTTEQAQPQRGNPSTSEAPPGLIGNPGGVVGKAACDATEVVNELAGIPVCSK